MKQTKNQLTNRTVFIAKREGENVDKLKKTINDIEHVKDLLQNKPEQDTVDYKLYDILNDALELLKEQRWIPTSEKLPDTYDDVLVYGKKFGIETMHIEVYMDVSKRKNCYEWSNDHDYYVAVEGTWWKPLPKPPKDGEQEWQSVNR